MVVKSTVKYVRQNNMKSHKEVIKEGMTFLYVLNSPEYGTRSAFCRILGKNNHIL